MSQLVNQKQPAEDPPARHLSVAEDASTWDMWAEHWTRHLAATNRSETTVETYLKSLRGFVRWAVAQRILGPEEVDHASVETFLAAQLARPKSRGTGTLSPSTVHRDYRHLKVFFAWFADTEDLANPMAKVGAPKTEEKVIDSFSDDELRALLGTCKGKGFAKRRDTAILRMLLDTGIRRSELAGIHLADVDQSNQIVRVQGKGRRERLVPYGSKTAEAIDSYIRVRARHRDRDRTDALWLADSPHRGQLGYEGIHQVLERRGKEAGVDNVHSHRFRHTAASAFLEAGGTEGQAMLIFGWRTRSMLDRYGADQASRRAIEAAHRLTPGDRI